nr:reverse transcriptase domain-containing protein [Tanacetum cinerariifolium]
MPTWCHMFNSTLIGAARVWFDELPPESIYGYKDLRAAFVAYFMQQKKYVKDPVEIHNIKQSDGETIEDFMKRFKIETGRMKGAPECMRISGFMHGVNNPELTKRLNEHVPKTMEEIIITTTAFIRGEAAVASKKKGHPRGERGSNRFAPLTKKPKEILATEASKFQPPPPPPMVTPVEKRSSSKFCDFHNDKGHSTDECMQLKKQIDEAIQAEVQKLVDTRIMREVYYHGWLSNPVMDCYPLSEIDWKMESLCGYPFKCFLDAYKGYHQKQLAKADEEKTAFHTGQGVYCYTKMSFGLKNADATYQRLMDKAFESQVGRNIEVYVDDLVVKSHTEAEMVRYIEETFRTLRKINMKLNPKKCSFGLAEGVFLGKISAAVLDLKKCIKKSDFRWTAEAEQAFQQLKQHLSDLPLLVAPNPQEELIMYLSATYGAVSAVLMTERGTTQTPIYFISRALQGPELNYSPMEKLVLSLVFAAKRLRWYFQAHPVTVITDQPIKQVNVDSKLVANQVLGTYVAKEDNMIKYLEIVRGLVSGFTTFSISQVPQSKNKQADALSKIASTSFAHLSKQVLVEVLENKSIKEKEVAAVIEEDGPTWMTQIADYLKEGVLPGDNKEARKLRLKARQYELREGVLYRRSFLTPWLRCVGPLQAYYVMREIHEGSCSMHAGPRSVVAKAIRLGYYWPTMHKDARDMIRKCNDCQIHRPVTRHPQQPLTSITAPWSFYKWGIDIAGPFPEGPRKVKFLIVAMDYFTKWVEAKAVATITGGQVKRFIWDNIVCCFGATPKLGLARGASGARREALGNRAYKLQSTDRTVLPRTWNVTNLKRCYL